MKRLEVGIIAYDNRSVSFVISKRYNRTQIAVEYSDELTSSDDRSFGRSFAEKKPVFYRFFVYFLMR